VLEEVLEVLEEALEEVELELEEFVPLALVVVAAVEELLIE
tara:strand:- start:154 stop:276 length:123 start_codon:yes stop_codon:yes gene_type:complete